jgi:hypothetical protein
MNVKNKYLVAEEIEKSFGKNVSDIKKEWKVGGIYQDNHYNMLAFDPEIEPEDPLIFFELLEYLKPDMTFLQFKKIESEGIWNCRVYEDVTGEFKAKKTLDLVRLLESIEKHCS